jgi:GntR family transcriptional repressor for pyruvate dehydrogenase complex
MASAKRSRKPKKSEVVASKIRDYIVQHGLNAGDRLPTEGELAERFGVSRVSVREATKALGFLGILEAAPRRGLTVGHISMKRLSRYLGFHFAVGNYPVDELIDTRVVIEIGGLRHVAEKMKQDPSIYDNLNEINERLRQATSVQQWIKLETEFHGTLVSASGLRGLSAFNDLLQVFFRRFRADFPLVQWKMAAKSHQEIIDALRGGDHLSATDLLTQHIESLSERINRTNEANKNKKLGKNSDGRENGKTT